jgi:hypothetical protein
MLIKAASWQMDAISAPEQPAVCTTNSAESAKFAMVTGTDMCLPRMRDPLYLYPVLQPSSRTEFGKYLFVHQSLVGQRRESGLVVLASTVLSPGMPCSLSMADCDKGRWILTNTSGLFVAATTITPESSSTPSISFSKLVSTP